MIGSKNISDVKNRNFRILIGVLFIFSIIPFFLSHEYAIGYSTFNYFILQAILFLILVCIDVTDRNRFLLSPSFIAVSYININFIIGSIAFKNELVFDFVLSPYGEWRFMHLSMGYFNLANFFIVISYFATKRIKLWNIKNFHDLRRRSRITLILAGIFLMAIFSFIEIDLSFFGGQGSFSIVPKSLGAILIFVVLFRNFRLGIRLIFYGVIIISFAIVSYDAKREAIFLLLPILLLESTRYPLKFKFSKVILIGVCVVFLGYLIIVMSILRGYGNYNPKSFLDATNYVSDYVRSDFFIPSFMNNIEVSYTYFHSNNAIEHILKDAEKLAYGATIIKPFFILFPREHFPGKPESIIERYTSSFSEKMRQEGVSWPVSFQSELFWNFHFFGVLIGMVFFFIFNSVYRNVVHLIKEDQIINYIPLLYLYQQLLVLFRGSGLDHYLIDIIFSFLIFSIVKLSLRIMYIKDLRMFLRSQISGLK